MKCSLCFEERSNEVCDGISLMIRVCCMVFEWCLRNHDRDMPVELFCLQQGTSVVLHFQFKWGHETRIPLVAPTGTFLLDVDMHVYSC